MLEGQCYDGSHPVDQNALLIALQCDRIYGTLYVPR